MSRLPGTYSTPGLGRIGRQLELPGGGAVYQTEGGLRIIVAREPGGPAGAMLWHLSISHADRDPTWAEISDARYRLLPDDALVAMLLPPRDQYLNVHEHCFHLWEV